MKLIGTWVCVGLLGLSCATPGPEACEDLGGRSQCERAEIENGRCAWLDAVVVDSRASDCAASESRGMCVGIESSTQQGCFGYACHAVGAGGDTPNAYVQERMDGSTAVIVNPECGPAIAGDWTSCGPGSAPAACACACGG